MKLAVIGGAGVRAPLLIGSLAKRAVRMDIGEVSIFDIDARKVRLIAPLIELILEKAGRPFKLHKADSPEDALRDADAVITTIREGFESGRARDERICTDLGLIGQETTGPAGFAFACRSAPGLVDYARRLFDLNPDAWLINFTNPAGIVTEALRGEGFERVVGVCDSADSGRRYACDLLNVEADRIETLVAGLNHLSFTTSLKVDGKERLYDLISDEEFLRRGQSVFPAELVGRLNCYLNEYLYYYLLRDEALAAMLAEDKTRGEKILEWNEGLLSFLEGHALADELTESLEYYFRYVRRRNESYMDYAKDGEYYMPSDDEEGYAGVALDFLEALSGNGSKRMVLCAPNEGAIPSLDEKAVVEVSCEIGANRIEPVKDIFLPAEALRLVEDVKRYETAAVEAIRGRSTEAAMEALALHPLVGRGELPGKLFGKFRAAQPSCFEGWL